MIARRQYPFVRVWTTDDGLYRITLSKASRFSPCFAEVAKVSLGYSGWWNEGRHMLVSSARRDALRYVRRKQGEEALRALRQAHRELEDAS